MQIKKSAVVISVVVLLGFFTFYRYSKEVFQGAKQDEFVVQPTVVEPPKATAFKEVSATITYDTPGDYPDSLRFVVALDTEGRIQSIQTLDAETNEIPEKKKEFNDQINVLLKGKKLSELSAIDKVGKSSLTTDAFNNVLDQLKAGL